MSSANAANRLIEHYRATARDLPWRARPGAMAPDPYRVWLSEVMLQQTTVAAVAPRFERFITRWPTIEALAAAPDEEVLGEWAGLGYYARARNLIACAREVARLGAFPTTEAGLRALPGVGDYTAAAIAAIAFNERVAVVDTNVSRVISRLHGLESPNAFEVRALTLEMTPAEAPGDFAQAMMDLGATICRPKAPSCDACPLAPHCLARASGEPERFPAPKIKASRPVRFGTAYWCERNGSVWLTRRPPRGLLGGMAALPSDDWNAAGPSPASHAEIRHVFTHFELRLSVVQSPEPLAEGWWQPLESIDQAGLPTLFRKAVAQVLRLPDRRAAA